MNCNSRKNGWNGKFLRIGRCHYSHSRSGFKVWSILLPVRLCKSTHFANTKFPQKQVKNEIFTGKKNSWNCVRKLQTMQGLFWRNFFTKFSKVSLFIFNTLYFAGEARRADLSFTLTYKAVAPLKVP